MVDSLSDTQMSRAERKDAVRGLIISAAAKAFSASPYSEVGMRGLAKSAGITAPTLFAHFPKGKAQIYEHVTGRKTPDAIAALFPEIDALLEKVAFERVGTPLGAEASALRAKLVVSD